MIEILIKQYFLVIAFLALCLPAFAQLNATRLYTIKDGLPSSETERCFISKDGTLWSISTQGLVSYFDGQKFTSTPISSINGTPSFHEDNNGLWLLGLSKSLLFRDNKWLEIKRPENITSYIKNKGSDEVLLINSKFEYFNFNPHSASFEMLGQISVPDSLIQEGYQFYDALYYPDTSYILRLLDNPGSPSYIYADIEDDHPKEVNYDDNGVEIKINDTLSLIRTGSRNTPYQIFWLKNGDKQPVYIEDEGGKAVEVQNCELRIIQDKLWFVRNNLTFFQGNDNIYEIWKMENDFSFSLYCRFELVAPTAVRAFEIDKLGNVWIASHAGILKVYPSILFCSEEHPNMVGGMHVMNEDEKGNIWFGSYRNGMAKFNGSVIEKAPLAAQPYQRFLPGTWKDEDGFMYFFLECPGYCLIKSNGIIWEDYLQQKFPPEERFTGYYLHPLSNGMLSAGTTSRGLALIDPPFKLGQTWEFKAQNKGINLKNIITISEDKKGQLWLGRLSQGIAVYNPELDTAITWLKEENYHLGAISSLVDSKNTLWLGTQQGLAYLKHPDQFDIFSQNVNDHLKLLHLPGCDDQTNRLVTSIKEFQDYLLFGNMTGFGLIDLNSFENNPEQPLVYFFNTVKDFPGGSSEQNAAMIDQLENYWIGNDLGALRINGNSPLLDTSSVTLLITEITTGRGDSLVLDDNNKIRLAVADRSVTFKYRILDNDELLPGIWTNYRLEIAGNNNDLLAQESFIQTDSVSFGYLPPGRHKLIIQLMKNNQVNDERVITIIIPKTLQENTWFWIGLLSFVLGILFVLYRQRQIHAFEKQQLLTEKEQLQIQAIVSSLNPHFINNTLHWLQAKVFQDKTAVKVIDRLAKNIKILFQRSRSNEPFHALSDEIKLVEHYLLIQENRFGNRYEFILPPNAVIESLKDLKVPLMQLQIHVENAIEHGLRNREEASYLKLEIQDLGEQVLFIIEDDGIGFSNAKQMRSLGTQQGTKMLKNLHKIFNKKNRLQIVTELEENFYIDTNTKTYGTRIKITIPKEYNYELESN